MRTGFGAFDSSVFALAAALLFLGAPSAVLAAEAAAGEPRILLQTSDVDRVESYGPVCQAPAPPRVPSIPEIMASGSAGSQGAPLPGGALNGRGYNYGSGPSPTEVGLLDFERRLKR